MDDFQKPLILLSLVCYDYGTWVIFFTLLLDGGNKMYVEEGNLVIRNANIEDAQTLCD